MSTQHATLGHPSTTNSMVMSPKKTQPLKCRVRKACINCSKAHACCDKGRPCRRCIKYGIEDSCYDVTHHKRGRKRNSQKNQGQIKQSIKLHPQNMILHTVHHNSTSPDKPQVQNEKYSAIPLNSNSIKEKSDTQKTFNSKPDDIVTGNEEGYDDYHNDEVTKSIVSQTLSNICLSRINNAGDLNRGVLVSRNAPFLSMLSQSAQKRWNCEGKPLTTWFEMLDPSVYMGHYADLICMSSTSLQDLVKKSIEFKEDPISIDHSLSDIYPGTSLERTIFGNVLQIKARTLGRTQSNEIFEFYRSCHIIFDRASPHKLRYVVSYLQW